MQSRILGSCSFAAVLVSLVVGCGNDDGSSGSGGAAGVAGTSAGQAGSVAQAGTSSVGAAGVSAGGSGSGSGGANVGGATGSAGQGNASNYENACKPMDIGYESSTTCMGTDLPVFPRGYTLMMPMTTGQTYAISYGVVGHTNPTVEIWGTSEPCGDKLELLSSEKRAEGKYCVELHPSAAYTSVFMSVSESSSGAQLLTLCPDGSCQ